MMKFSCALMTLDRAPKRNFLGETIANLKRAGVFDSPHLRNFALADSGSEDMQFIYDAFSDVDRGVYIATGMRSPTANAAFALQLAAKYAADDDWVLFLEDDIDVCDKFLESTAAWLEDHAEGQRGVFSLGANYEAILTAYNAGHTSWVYALDSYYGTLAVAMRRADAVAIAAYLSAHADAHTYDLHIAHWAAQQEPKIDHFLTPVPSFIQHIGTESVIRPGSEFHQYSSWQGREWSYLAEKGVGA